MARFRIDDPATANQTKGRFRIDGGDSKPSDIESFASGVGDALSFGFGDELLGIGGGALGTLTGKDFNTERERITNWSRGQQMLAQQENPLSYMGGQFAGAIGGGGLLGAGARGALGAANLAGKAANFARGVGPVGRIGAATATGALGGGVYGYGSADDDRRLEAAGEGALWGSVLGGAGHGLLGEFVPHIAGRIGDSMNPKAGAARVFGELQDRFRQDPAQLAKDMDEAPQGAMLLDTLKGGVQIAKGAASRPGFEREATREALDERNIGMLDKAVKDLWRTFTGKQGNAIDAGMEIARLEDEARDLTKALYGEVENMQVARPTQQAMDFLQNHAQPGQIYHNAVQRTVRALQRGTEDTTGAPRMLGAGADMDAMLHEGFFWRRLMEEVNTEYAALQKKARTDPLGVPRGSAWKEVSQERKALANELRSQDMLGDKFAQAQDIFANRMQRAEAIAFGYGAAKQTGDINIKKVLRKIDRMTPEARYEARRGIVAGLVNEMESVGDLSGKADVLRRLIGSPAKRNAINRLMGGKVKKDGSPYASSQFTRLAERMEAQHKLFENSGKTGIDVNSMTADKLAALRSQESLSNPTGGGIKDTIWRMLTGHAADQYNEAVSNELLRLLRTPTVQVKNEINAAGGLKNWMKQQTTLARSVRKQQQIGTQRQRALLGNAPQSPMEYLLPNLGAPLGGLYANAAFGSPMQQLYGGEEEF